MFNDMGQILGFLAACFVTVGAMLAMLTYAEATLDREIAERRGLLSRLRPAQPELAPIEVTNEPAEVRRIA